MAEDNTPTNVVDEMYKAGLEIFDENIFKNNKVDHIKFTILLEEKGFTFKQVEDLLNKVYMAQSDDNPQGFENLSKEDWIKYTEPFIDTPTNVVDDINVRNLTDQQLYDEFVKYSKITLEAEKFGNLTPELQNILQTQDWETFSRASGS